MKTYTVSKRLKIAKDIFTVEEFQALIHYELLLLFETGKQKLEWMLYVLIFLIWVKVISLFSTIPKVVNSTKKNSTIQVNSSISFSENASKTRQIDQQFNLERVRVENVCEEINKVSQSKLSSQEILQKTNTYAKKFNLDIFFVLALIQKECDFKETAIAKDYNTTGSLGWSQATKYTWDDFNAKYVWPKYKKVYSYQDRLDPDKSLEFICWYLDYLKKNFEEIVTLEDLYTAYNGGPHGLHKESARKNAKVCLEFYNKYKEAYLN